MKNENSSKLLRTHAEKIIRKKAEISAWDTDGMTLEQIEQTLYELRVHQVELELQNEELRRVQAELEASKAHYFDFYNLAPVGYCTISETGFLLEANLVIARWLGLTRSKLTRTTFDRYILRTDVDIFYSLQKRLFATNEPQECELRLVKPDKTALWVNLTASNHLGPDGTSECRLVVSDISERKQTEEKYSTLFNNSYDAVFIAEPVSRRLVDCNKAAEMLTGYSRSELLSMQADALHPRDRLAETMTGFQKQVEGISKLVESEIVTKANIRIAVEIAASAITTKNGNYLVGVFRNISERLNFERELAVSDSYNKALIEAIPYLMFVLDKDGYFLGYSAGNDENLAMPKELFLGKNVFEALPQPLAMQTKNTLDAVLCGQSAPPFEYSLPTPHGSGYFECKMSAFGREKVVAIISNITGRKLAEEKQQLYQSLVTATLESTADGILVTDNDGRITLFNAKFAELLQAPTRLLEQDMDEELLKYALTKLVEPEEFLTKARELRNTPDAVSRDEIMFTDGHIFERYSQPQRLGDKIVGRVWSFRDITEKKLDDEHIRYLSFHDALTGLHNRRYFEEEVQRMDTARQLPISIISGDVNGLKLTNDVFGHARGDELIRTAAQNIQTCCRAEDVVARFGGDEFMVFLPKCDEATALEIIDRIMAQCRDKTVEGIPVSLALGAATKNEPIEDINTVVNQAETRMYKNKSSEVNRIRLDTLEALERTVYEKDYQSDHTQRLQEFATSFGKYLQLSVETISDLAMLAALHDIGKIGIADEILNKQGALSADEWELIKTHPEVGNRILRATRMVTFGVEEGVLMHHEHWDGSGYPKGLAAEAIPFISRAVAIIDAYDVMTHDRPYHLAITHEQAIAELQRCAGTQFDPELVAKFVEFVGADG